MAGAKTHKSTALAAGLWGSSIFIMASALQAPVLVQIKPFALHDRGSGVNPVVLVLYKLISCCVIRWCLVCVVPSGCFLTFG